jgi:alpha-tubulin suppressor-like RCC1 family protein
MYLRIQAAALPLLALILIICSPQAFSATAEPNAVIEVAGEGLVYLEVELRPEGGKEQLRFQYKGTNGLIVGGIALPADGGADYEITAYDEQGKSRYAGKGWIPSLLKGDRPLRLPLLPTDQDSGGIMVSLSRERLVLEAKPADEPNSFTVELQALDPRGYPSMLDPKEVSWRLTDTTQFELLPYEDRYDVVVVRPLKETILKPYAELCDDPPKVVLCTELNCRVVSLCSDPWVAISAGHSHTCALKKSGAAYCWGSNNLRELASKSEIDDFCSGTTIASSPNCVIRPQRVECPANAPCLFTKIAAGGEFTVAIDTKGNTWSWGNTSPIPQLVIAMNAGKQVFFEKITAGEDHGCGLSGSGEMWCWGKNNVGQAGAPLPMTRVPFNSAVRVLAPMKFSKVVAGGKHTCALNTAGDGVACWGSDSHHQTAGPGASQYPAGSGRFFFQHFGGLTPILDLAVSEDSSCVTLGNGNGVNCWGSNSRLNQHLTALGTPDQLVAGSGHVCALSGEQASCLGANFSAQLGIGTTTMQPSLVLTPVNTPPAKFSTLSSSHVHNCGITPDGDAYCWGRAMEGQIGDGSANWSVQSPSKVEVQ